MFGLFKKNKSKKVKMPQLVDLNNNIILDGDTVTALRYDLGVCRLLILEGKYVYQSEKNGEQVSWVKMIDASTDRQKVEKIVLP